MTVFPAAVGAASVHAEPEEPEVWLQMVCDAETNAMAPHAGAEHRKARRRIRRLVKGDTPRSWLLLVPIWIPAVAGSLSGFVLQLEFVAVPVKELASRSLQASVPSRVLVQLHADPHAGLTVALPAARSLCNIEHLDRARRAGIIDAVIVRDCGDAKLRGIFQLTSPITMHFTPGQLPHYAKIPTFSRMRARGEPS